MIKDVIHRFKWSILLATILSAASALVGVGMIAMITQALGSLGEGNADLEYPFAVFAAAAVLVMALGFTSQHLLIKLGTAVVYDIRRTLLQRVLATSYENVERIGGPRVMAAMKSDVATLSNGLLLAPTFIYNAVTVLLCLSYMLHASWKLFLLVAVAIALIVAMLRIVVSHAIEHQNDLREYEDSLFSSLGALTNGGKEIHLSANRRRHFYEAVMLPLFGNIRHKTIKAESLFNGLQTCTGTLIFFLIGSVAYGAHALVPEMKMQVVVIFVLTILYMVEPMSGLIDVTDKINAVRVSLGKIERLGLVEASRFAQPPRGAASADGPVDCLSIEQVCYQYGIGPGNGAAGHDENSHRFAIGPIAAEFRAGEVTFLIGGNGSGKSTFAKVLTGLYPAQSGHIRLNGLTVGTHMSMDQYQSRISAIFSDTHVFSHVLSASGEIAEDGMVNAIIGRLRLEEHVRCEAGVLSSTTLSQGQTKRLALLASFVQDAQICVYDELAAEQDPSFRRYFYKELLPEMKRRGKIVIIISHDEQYFDAADQVIKFEEGRIMCREAHVPGQWQGAREAGRRDSFSMCNESAEQGSQEAGTSAKAKCEGSETAKGRTATAD